MAPMAVYAAAKKGDLAKAEAEFRKASELKPDFADAHGALSILLAGQGKPEAYPTTPRRRAWSDAPHQSVTSDR